jgi:hypothetical protein
MLGTHNRRGEAERPTDLPLTNFRGIELRDFPAEIARLALIIAEYQCDVQYRGERLALAEFLPLDKANWITCGNALQIDWLSVCPPTGKKGVKLRGDDLFSTPLDQSEIDFANEGGETYLCGNPPYLGKGKKEDDHLSDMESIFGKYTTKYGYIDYVGCWFMKSAEYLRHTKSSAALAATNSICQGRQLPQVWPHVLREDIEIFFAHHSFKWANSAVHNAGVICVIVGISTVAEKRSKTINDGGFARSASNINPYLIDAPNLIVKSVPKSLCRQLSPMLTGSVPNDGGNLILTGDEARELVETFPSASNMLHAFYGSKDYLQGIVRNCLVIGENDLADACAIPSIAERLDRIARLRAKSKKKETREQLASVPHRFQHVGEIPSERPRKFFSVKVADDFFLKVFGFVFRFVFC